MAPRRQGRRDCRAGVGPALDSRHLDAEPRCDRVREDGRPDPVEVHADRSGCARGRIRSGFPVPVRDVPQLQRDRAGSDPGGFPELGLAAIHLAAAQSRPKVGGEARLGPELQPLAGFRVQVVASRSGLALAFRDNGGLVAGL